MNYLHHIKNLSLLTLQAFIMSALALVFFIFLTSRSGFINGIRSYDVLTGSMEPRVPIGSIVFVTPSTIYNIGEVLTFNRKGITVTHRIKNIIGDMYQTKGDANNASDVDLVGKKDVIGRVIFTLPLVGGIITYVRTVPGFILLIGTPALIFIGFEIWNIKNEFEKEVEKKILRKLAQNETV